MHADAGLATISSRFAVGAGAGVAVEATRAADPADPYDRLCQALEASTREARRGTAVLLSKARAAYPVPIPAMPYTVTGGVPAPGAGLAGSAHLGPRTGYFWDVTRLTVDGLTGSGGIPQSKAGSAVAPASNALIASITGPLVPGTYIVSWNVGLSAGAPAAADVDNFGLQMTGVLARLASDNPAALGEFPQANVQITIPAGNANNLSIVAIGAATAGVTYSAQLTLTPVAGGDQVTVYRGISGVAVGAQRLHTFEAEGPANIGGSEWTPGKGTCMLRDGDALLLSGSGLSASSLVMSGDALQIEAPWIGEYLL